MRFGLRTLATLMIGTLGFVGLVGSTATAAVADTNPSFVGHYTFHATIGTESFKFAATINADGTAVAPGGVAHWTNSGTTITIVYKNSSIKQTFVGKQSAKGIATRKKPGSYHDNHGATGTWFAVKVS